MVALQDKTPMPDSDVWPPKPSLLDPLAEYDEFIEARLPTLSAMTVNWDLLVPKSHLLLPGFGSLMRLMSRLTPGSPAPVNDRTLLLQALREDRGLDFWQAQAVVRSYYQRHGMELTTRAALKTLLFPIVGVGLALGAVTAILIYHYLSYHRDALLRQPNHGAAIVALDNAKSLLQTVSLTLIGLVYGSWLLRYLILRARHKRAGAVKSPGRKRPSG